MKAQTTAIVACAVVLALIMVSASAVTYSWWSDSEETEITITSGSLDVSTNKFDVEHNGVSLGTGLGSIPGLISVQYDDGRSATTEWWSESDSLTIAGNPGDVNVEILYEVTFSGNIDYKYIIDVVCPEGIDATVSVKDEGDNAVTYGSWKAPASEPTGPFEMKFYVSILIKSIDADVYGEKLKIVNMITQYNNPIDIWDGSTPASLPATLNVDVTDKVISINDAKALAYLSTLNNNWDSSAYGSKWMYSIELNTNIDLNGLDWTPINLNNFVAFDGNGHTIYNLNVSAGDNAGLFASITCNDIGVTYVKDLNIVNAVVEGKECVGALVGAGTQAVVSNVVVDNAVLTGTKYVGGIFGHGNGSVNDCVVKNSFISVKYDGKNEAGGLIGYLSNDGLASTVDKVISGNLVENVTVFAPTVASGLVSQPNSINSGGAIIVIKDNSMVDVTIITGDDTADWYVSYNVGDKSKIIDNTQTNCKLIKGALVIEDSVVAELEVENDDASVDLKAVEVKMPVFDEDVMVSAQIVADASAEFIAKLNDLQTLVGGINVDIKDMDGNPIHTLGVPATVTMKILGDFTGGKLQIYHEDGTSVTATVELDEMYSEVSFAADRLSSYFAVESKVWNGTADTAWYNDTDTEFVIGSPEELAGLSELVSNGNDFSGKTIKLNQYINLYCENGDEPKTFTPIGDKNPFKGTFDGQGYSIINLYQSGWALGYEWGVYGSLGLFGEIIDATIKNLTIEGAESFVEGGDVGGITGSASGTCVFENITIKDSTFATYNNGLGGIIGWSGAGNYTFKDIEISEDVVLGGLWGSYDSSVGGVVGQAESGATYNFENVTVSCRLDVYNDCTASYDYYNYRMCGMLMGRLKETTTIDGANYPDTSKYNITCTNVTVTYGDWHNYHYCEPTPAGMNGGRGMRVEPGYQYGGLPADYDHSQCTSNHMNLLPFDQIFGGNQFDVKGLKTYNGVTVIYPSDDNE